MFTCVLGERESGARERGAREIESGDELVGQESEVRDRENGVKKSKVRVWGERESQSGEIEGVG